MESELQSRLIGGYSHDDNADPPPLAHLSYSGSRTETTIDMPPPDPPFRCIEMKRNGAGRRWCEKCHHFKPDRAHHCSSCRRCVLKMDHHCPWVNNCVGFRNYKMFCLFIFWGSIYCIHVLSCTFGLLGYYTSRVDLSLDKTTMFVSDFHLMMLLVASILFSLVFILFAIMHLQLLLSNQTTIESLQEIVWVVLEQHVSPKPVRLKSLYYMSMRHSLISVFGPYPSLWLLPIFSSKENGFEWDISTNLCVAECN